MHAVVNRRSKTPARPRELNSMEIGGTYPMLYAFFDADGGLRRDAVTRQIESSIACGASGIAVLGLGTEVHKLGRDEAHRRIAENVHKLRDHIPGGATHVQSNWVGDTLNLDVTAMGQTVAARIEVEENKVRCKLLLPGMLGLFAAPIEAALKAKGGDLLLEDKSRKG